TSSPPSMTTSEPMSCWDMTLSADESGSPGATGKSVPPLTPKMSLTFMSVSGERVGGRDGPAPGPPEGRVRINIAHNRPSQTKVVHMPGYANPGFHTLALPPG